LKDIEELEDEIRTTPIQLINYSFRIYEDLYNRFNKHIHLLKRLDNSSISKQSWITEAIKEKLEQEKQSSPESLARDKHISFRVEKQLSKSIEKSVETIRMFRRSFSKKQWFVEAIYEKLEREEIKAKELLKQMAKSIKSKE
jgi:hypothetical protein